MLLDEPTLSLLLAIFLFAIGACIGSFLNVVAHRLPLDMSVVCPRSHCPNCSSPVPALGLIPIFGYFLVRMRCRNCGANVSWVYPAVEFICAVGTVFLVFHTLTPAQLMGTLSSEADWGTPLGNMRFQPLVTVLTHLFLFYTAIPLTLIDLEHRILPDAITLGGTPIALFLGGANVSLGWHGAVLGAAVGSGVLFFVAKTYEIIRGREGLGFGDVKYMGLIGALVGWQGVLLVLGLASVLGSVVGIVLGLRKQAGLQTALPFGPFLAAAALVVSLWQPLILDLFFADV